MATNLFDPFKARDSFNTGKGTAGIYRLERLEKQGRTDVPKREKPPQRGRPKTSTKKQPVRTGRPLHVYLDPILLEALACER